MSPQKIRFFSGLIFALGLASAAAVWCLSSDEPENELLDDPLAEKRYRRELRVIGGQANQLSADFQEWFEARWRGRQLGYTLVVLTVLGVGVFRFVAVRLDVPPK